MAYLVYTTPLALFEPGDNAMTDPWLTRKGRALDIRC